MDLELPWSKLIASITFLYARSWYSCSHHTPIFNTKNNILFCIWIKHNAFWLPDPIKIFESTFQTQKFSTSGSKQGIYIYLDPINKIREQDGIVITKRFESLTYYSWLWYIDLIILIVTFFSFLISFGLLYFYYLICKICLERYIILIHNYIYFSIILV